MRRARGLAGCDRYPGRAGRDNQKASALRWRAASGQGRLGRRTPLLRYRTKQDKIPGTFALTCRSRANESGEQFATGVSLDLSLQVRLTNGTYLTMVVRAKSKYPRKSIELPADVSIPAASADATRKATAFGMAYVTTRSIHRGGRRCVAWRRRRASPTLHRSS